MTDHVSDADPTDVRLQELYGRLRNDAGSVDSMHALRRVRDRRMRASGPQRALIIAAPAILLIVAVAAVAASRSERVATDPADPDTSVATRGCENDAGEDRGEATAVPTAVVGLVTTQVDGCRTTIVTFEGDGAPAVGDGGLFPLEGAVDDGQLLFVLPERLILAEDLVVADRFDNDYGFAAIVGDSFVQDFTDGGSPEQPEPIDHDEAVSPVASRKPGLWANSPFDRLIASQAAALPEGAGELLIDHGAVGTTTWRTVADPPRLIVETSYGSDDEPPVDGGDAIAGRTHVVAEVPTRDGDGVQLLLLNAPSEGTGAVALFTSDGRPAPASLEIDGRHSTPPRDGLDSHETRIFGGVNAVWDWATLHVEQLDPGDYQLRFYHSPQLEEGETSVYDFSVEG